MMSDGGGKMKKIIVIEDEIVIREELIQVLERAGYRVEAPTEFLEIVTYVQNLAGDLVLLDINLPNYDGYYLCKEIRQTSEIPIIMVTSRNTQTDELISMNFGADDFVTKPYNTQILLARIASVLRRSQTVMPNDVLCYREFQLTPAQGTLSYAGKQVELTKNELKILLCLMKVEGTIVSRERLMEFLWHSDMFVDDNTLSVNVTRLRKKMFELSGSDVIETKRGLGYILP